MLSTRSAPMSFRIIRTAISRGLNWSLIGVICSATTLAQQTTAADIPLLQIDQPAKGQLKNAEARTYRLPLEAGRFVRVVVMQQGVDVLVSAWDGNKKKLAEMDSPNGRNGPEKLDFVAEAVGDYFFEVKAFENEPLGNYEIKLVELRAATDDDRTR